MSDPSAAEDRPLRDPAMTGLSAAALVLGLVGLLFPFPPAALVFALAGVAAGLGSRRALRRTQPIHGVALSVAGTLVGVAAALYRAPAVLLPMISQLSG